MSAKRPSAAASFLKFGLLSAIAGVLSVAILAPAIAVAGAVGTAGVSAFESLPAYIKPVNASQASNIYALRDGKPEKIATFFHENRVEVPFEEISPNLINAVIAVEDPRFYQHGGVDIISLFRATLTNLATFGEGPGASTITMQYVRQSQVEAANLSGDAEAIAAATEVTVERKLKEIRLAIALENQVSKKDILAGYLNLVFLGNQINGVQTASQYYFGTNAKNLTVPQAAYLAAMLKSPNDYKPDEAENLERGIGRRNYVIQAMADEGYITQAQAETYKAAPVQTNITKSKQGCEANQTTAFFCDFTVWTIRNSKEFGVTSEDRELLLRRGGLEIYTTLDLDIQQAAFEASMELLPPDNEWAFGTASVSVETGTGRIIAMAQNRYFDQSDAPAPGRTSVNFNTDKPFGGSSGFQPGSTYKIFTIAEWLKNGNSLGDRVDGRIFNGEDVDQNGEIDKVKIWDVANEFRASCGSVGGFWEVNNSGDKTVNEITVARAIVTSQNTAFASMASKVDLCAIRDTAMSFGVHRADGTELLYYPSTILGTNEIAPLTMAAAYAAIGNNGIYCSPVGIDKVVLRKTGESIPIPQTACSQAVTPEIAAAMSHGLRAVMTGGTGAAANPNDGTPLAGKTGTTDNRIHTWMSGYSSKVATATWVGNVSGLTTQTGKSVDGLAVSSVRHAVWKRIMAKVNAKYGGDPFPAADPKFVNPTQLVVSNVATFTPESAKAQLIADGFNVQVITNEVPSSAPPGTIAYTKPAIGSTAIKGSIIKLYISAGGRVSVPSVKGLTIEDAAATLQALGLTVTLPQPSQSNLLKCDATLPNGVAYGTNPEAGKAVSPSSAIVLIPNTCG